MRNQGSTIFETKWDIYYKKLNELETCFHDKLIYICEPNLFQLLAITNQPAGACVYWFEVLGRAYLASASGLMRTLRWLNGIKSSIEQGNILSFASNLRGLLESAADQCYSLKAVPKFLAENYDFIVEQLYCKSPKGTIGICEELENLLIHFYHAKKNKKQDGAEVQHFALTTAEYLGCLQGERTGSVFNLYSQLCNLTHPAKESLDPFVEENEGGYLIKTPNEMQAINNICYNNEDAIMRITAGVNCCLLTLLVLNEYPIEEFYTDSNILNLIPPGWANIKDMINK